MERIAEALGMDPVTLREHERAAARRHHGHGPDAAASDCSALVVLDEAVQRTDFRAQARGVQGDEPGDRARALLSRRGLHRQRRAAPQLEGAARAHRDRRAHRGRQHGDRPGHAHDARADRRRRARAFRTRTSRSRSRTRSASPTAGPTVASRTCMVVGKILEECAKEMREKLGGLTPRPSTSRSTGGFAVLSGSTSRPTGSSGTTTPTAATPTRRTRWGCDVAELEIDPRHV